MLPSMNIDSVPNRRSRDVATSPSQEKAWQEPAVTDVARLSPVSQSRIQRLGQSVMDSRQRSLSVFKRELQPVWRQELTSEADSTRQAGASFPVALCSQRELDALLAHPTWSNQEKCLWTDLQTRFAYEGDQYLVKRSGLLNWQDMAALLNRLVTREAGKNLQQGAFVLEEYLLTCETTPPESFLLEGARLAGEGLVGDIFIRGDLLDPPRCVVMDGDGAKVLAGAALCHAKASSMASFSELADCLTPQERLLFHAFSQSVEKAPEGGSLGDVLSLTLERFNQALSPGQAQWAVDALAGRTKVTRLVQNLATRLLQLSYSKGFCLSPLDPLLSTLKRHEGGVYAIGGGQTLSLLQLPIGAMDRGLLPLDFRLEGDNRGNKDPLSGRCVNPAVAEVVEQNQRRTHLGADLNFVSPDQVRIYMRPDQQRLARMKLVQPNWIFLNVPSKSLSNVLTEPFLRALAAMRTSPALMLSAKSFIEDKGGVNVPATGLFRRLQAYQAGMEKQLIVLGGYFAAPWVLLKKPVHFVIAGEDRSRVEAFGRLLPDGADSPIKYDERAGDADQLFGTAIMGALKNQAVYTFAREVVRRAYEQLGDDKTQDGVKALEGWMAERSLALLSEAQEAVELLTSQSCEYPKGALGDSPIENFIAAPGVRSDFEHCMVSSEHPVFYAFVKELCGIMGVADQDQRHAALTALLANKVVNEGTHFGSRNSRDGVIDEVVSIAYAALAPEDRPTFEQFRQTLTPKSWLDKTTEGRSGIYPILKHLSDNQRPVPALMKQAASYYAQANPTLTALL